MRYSITHIKKSKHTRVRYGAILLLAVMLFSISVNVTSPGKARAAIASQGSTTGVTGANTSTTVSSAKPAATASGMVLIAQVFYNPGTNKGVTTTPPAGWTQAGTNILNGSWWQQIYYKVAGASEPATYTFTFSRAANAAVGIAAFSGVDTTGPIDDIVSYTSGGTSTTSHLAPSASASTNGEMMVSFWGFLTQTTASSIDAGMTTGWNTSTTNIGIAQGYKLLGNAGPTGTVTATTTASMKHTAFSIVLLPSVRPPGIVYVASSTNSCLSCTNISVTQPSNWQAGDLFITNIIYRNTATVTPPDSSWIPIGTPLNDGLYNMIDYYHVASNSDPATIQFNFSATVNAVIGVADYAGVDTSNPIDDTQTAIDAGSQSTHTAPSVTTTQSNGYYVGVWGFEGNFILGTGSTSFSSTLNNAWSTNDTSSIGGGSDYEPLGNAGASGTRFVTSANPNNSTQTRNTKALMRSIALKAFIPLPRLSQPVDGAVGVVLQPTFRLRNYVINPSSVKYRIELCSNSTCTNVISTFDQTVSQTGWSGQDADGGTAYIAGNSYATSSYAYYTMQANLTAGTQYFWRGYSYNTSGGYWTPPSNISSFVTSSVPLAPTLYTPKNTSTNNQVIPEFSLATTDGDGDTVSYKIEVCANSTCSVVLYTYDQTVSQTGWSGQDNDTFSGYAADAASVNNSTTAYFNPLNNYSTGTQYWWRAFAIDPLGSNIWSPSSAIWSFTVNPSQTIIMQGTIKQTKIL